MKNLFLALFAIAILALSSCDNTNSGGSASIETKADSVSYALGYSIGTNLIQQFPEINPAIMASAIQEVYDEKELTMFADVQNVNTFIQTYLQEEMNKKAEKNLEEGNAFLEQNKSREGVTVTESGLQYEVLNTGTGAKPTVQDQVRVHYHGTLIDGTVFDSSVDRGEPSVFGVGQVIPGWTEALQLMPVGSKWKVYLPTAIAYGANPRPGGVIEPNMALIFEVELLEIIEK